MIVILMGVSGAGKTTIGRRLAAILNWCFVEGDDLHPWQNVQKMSQGLPLSDRDREPWLMQIRERIVALQQQGQSAIITCSALKRRYRDILHPQPDGSIQFVYLKNDATTLRSRLEHRPGHFMKAEMLDSQLATLEEPENAIVVPVSDTKTPEQIAIDIATQLHLV